MCSRRKLLPGRSVRWRSSPPQSGAPKRCSPASTASPSRSMKRRWRRPGRRMRGRRGARCSGRCMASITIKDGVATAGHVNSFGSASKQNDIAVTDDIVWQRLKAAGAILIGKTTAPEFFHRITTNSRSGVTRNPWSLAHSPGGSSGGAAAALGGGGWRAGGGVGWWWIAPLSRGMDGDGGDKADHGARAAWQLFQHVLELLDDWPDGPQRPRSEHHARRHGGTGSGRRSEHRPNRGGARRCPAAEDRRAAVRECRCGGGAT